ncbi:MAG: DNA alkylation repair protein [Clostridium sp.]|nr:DNA alkylation repair protein [Prevotella sp.]MCM1428172.1 DNA alkylation repair protein [Clostridium sp.]MCM1474703.1 DNA alkylation repair protein [Muribaculaceae bacterium]
MDLKKIKHQFMAFRNGIVADAFHKAAAPYNIVFGLQIPQLGEIARKIIDETTSEERQSLARQLWVDCNVRESRLLACWLFESAGIDLETAVAFAADCRTQEEADILCWRVLRRLPFCDELKKRLSAEKDEGSRRILTALDR